MADENVYDLCKEFFQRIFGDPAVAAQVASDPQGALAAYGINDYEDLDFREVVADTYQGYDLPYGNTEALQSYASGGEAVAYPNVKVPPTYSGGYQAPADAVAHVQYATYAAYESNTTITQEIVNTQQLLFFDNSTNVDNSVEVGIDGNFQGEFNLETNNLNALGDGAVANQGDDNTITTGDGNVVVDGDENALNFSDGDQLVASRGGEINAATGDGSVVVDGDNEGVLVAGEVGDGAVLAGRDIEAPVNTGQFEGVLAGGDVEAQVQTGDGFQAGGDVSETVVGDGNQVANLDIDTSGGAGGTGGAGGAGGAGTGGAGAGGSNFTGDGGGNATGGAGAGGAGTGGAGGAGGGAQGGDGGDLGPINLSFGGGSPTNLNVAGSIEDSAVSTGGDAQNVQDVFVDEGAAFAIDGDASGSRVQDSFNTEINESTEINQEQDVRIEQSQVEDVDFSQDAPGAQAEEIAAA